jgi:hypothetical protein
VKKELIQVLFDQKYEGGRAFTPVVHEDGESFLASLMIKGCKRFGRIDLSHEADPGRFLNVVLIRDASEKLLAYFVCNQYTRPCDIPDHIMKCVLDEDYGMIVAADDDNNIKSVFFVDIYSKGAAPFVPVYQEYWDFERIIDTLVHNGCTFTDYPLPASDKPNLIIVRRDEE